MSGLDRGRNRREIWKLVTFGTGTERTRGAGVRFGNGLQNRGMRKSRLRGVDWWSDVARLRALTLRAPLGISGPRNSAYAAW
jgi:hypothetical protein